MLLVAWTYGGLSSHALSLMTHEVSHNNVFETAIFNDYFGILCNVGMGIPSSTLVLYDTYIPFYTYQL